MYHLFLEKIIKTKVFPIKGRNKSRDHTMVTCHLPHSVQSGCA